MRHHQRIGAQGVEEVAIDRYALDAQDAGQHLGEGGLDAACQWRGPIGNDRAHRTVS
jgi:hypothetical protein